MNRLLAALDLSAYAESVVAHAAWAATRLSASVELLHVHQRPDSVAARHDHSGSVGLGARSDLLDELARMDEAEATLARRTGRALLDDAAERLAQVGVEEVTTTHRHGDIVATIVDREAEADLVVIGKRGASGAFATRHLGSKVERVVRQSNRPVLVASRAFRPIERALIAFDNGPSARRAVSLAATSPLFADVGVRVVTVGGEDERSRAGHAWAADMLGDRLAGAENLVGSPAEALVAEADGGAADLIVMGAYGHSPLRSLIVGSTTTAVVRSTRLPVLLFR